jgi:hypothetical protein
MKRKSWFLGMLATGLALIATAGTPEYSRVVSSARSFGYYFRAMETTAGTLGPVERVAYSLILAASQPAPGNK